MKRKSGLRETSAGRILVVDDDVLVCRAITRTLRARGYDPIMVTTAKDALEQDCRFACTVVDIDLGASSGIDVAQEMIREGLTNHCVFFSATSDEASIKEAKAAGHFISKRDGVLALVAHLAQVAPVPRRRTTVRLQAVVAPRKNRG